MVTIERLYRLVEALPEEERDTAARVLEALAGLERAAPLVTLETAPLRDEPETEEERVAVAQARAELARGEAIPHAQVRRELGL
jgi:hypothetical protein